MFLAGEHHLAKIETLDQFLTDDFGILEAIGQQDDFRNEPRVRHHHGHTAKQGLEVHGQVGTGFVERVKGDENP